MRRSRGEVPIFVAMAVHDAGCSAFGSCRSKLAVALLEWNRPKPPKEPPTDLAEPVYSPMAKSDRNRPCPFRPDNGIRSVIEANWLAKCAGLPAITVQFWAETEPPRTVVAIAAAMSATVTLAIDSPVLTSISTTLVHI